MQIEERARAKINLALHVTGQRDDGYHLLDTIVTFAEIGDRLTFEPASKLSLTISGPEGDGLDTSNQNLVLQAAEALRQRFDRPDLGAAIHLEKNLPIASGIGGGSADAAAALRGLSRLWELPTTDELLSDIALKLGADVPMCLASRPARVTGIGENINPIELPGYPIVLVNPRVEVSTAAVFKKLESKTNSPVNEIPESRDVMTTLSLQRNDLQNPAIATTPAISPCLDTVAAFGTCCLARMSGSGATCFGIFDNRSAAQQAAKTIITNHPDWWVVASTTVS